MKICLILEIIFQKRDIFSSFSVSHDSWISRHDCIRYESMLRIVLKFVECSDWLRKLLDILYPIAESNSNEYHPTWRVQSCHLKHVARESSDASFLAQCTLCMVHSFPVSVVERISRTLGIAAILHPRRWREYTESYPIFAIVYPNFTVMRRINVSNCDCW